ncbi:putative reverse transcriptase domain-containing protein [Tanacetum coccineum]|uniref:Reverse transcriptase domain-containing protein n=1 Tax=Tanacetum coccineum TaxID=301880 RepID=A0ABQ5AEQ1_9ASTR
MCPPTTSDSSSKDSPSESYARLSCKRCRSPAATMPLPISASGALVPTRIDLLPPRKRFRDSYSSEESIEEDINVGVGVEVDTGIGMRVEVARDDRIRDIEAGQRQLEVGCSISNRERELSCQRGSEGLRQARRTRYYDRLRFRRLEAFTVTRLEALEAREANRNLRLGNDNDEGGSGNGDGNENRGGNGNVNHNENDRGARSVVRECTYQDFMKCQPLNFQGTEGVFGLIRWFEKIETVFHISNYPEKCQRELMKLMTEVYCPRNKIQKMERELWNLTMKNNDLATYTQRFKELTMMCSKMVPEEEDRVEKFIVGLPDNIHGNVMAVEPTRLQDVVRIANNLMDQKLKGYAVRNVENKRRLDINQRDYRRPQPPFKRQNFRGQNVARAYTAGTNKRKVYARFCLFTTSGHYKSECPKLKNQDSRNKTGNIARNVSEARGKAYVLGGGDADLNSNTITVDRRIAEANTVLRGCTLGLLGHPFNIDLIPVELGSFNIIIGMDWLANHHAVIICDEKIVRIPYGDEVMIV